MNDSWLPVHTCTHVDSVHGSHTGAQYSPIYFSVRQCLTHIVPIHDHCTRNATKDRSEPSVNTRIEKVYETTRFFVSLWLPNEHNIHTLHIVCAYIAHLLSSTFVNLKCMLIERWVCVDVQCNHVYVTPACQGKKDVMIVFNANLYYLCITVDNFPRLEHVSLTSWRL